jgi:beta-aspartyl-dipeptidase (metallo-type)
MSVDATLAFTLLRGGRLFAPEDLGRRDVLIFAGKIVGLADNLEAPAGSVRTDVVDVSDHIVLPGLIDGHCHPTGAGGVSGPETRSPPLSFDSLVESGITTVVGMLGGDGLTRHPLELVASVRALVWEGLSAYMLMGAYRVPPPTLSGDLQRDIFTLPECLGAGEIAVNDARSSQPTPRELARIVADAQSGGRIAGKRGVTNIHVGTGRGGLELLRWLRDTTDLPTDLIVPTHLNRSHSLLQEAIEWCRAGGVADLTTSLEDHLPGTVPVADAVAAMLREGVAPERITLSTDAGGVYAVTDDLGHRRLHRWSSRSLLTGVRRLHHDSDVDLSAAISMVTRNTARNMGLRAKGRVAVGFDADLLVVEPGLLSIVHLWALGRRLIADGVQIQRGTFDDG